MLGDKLTLLIHSCDKFSDLWDAHLKLLNKNWPDRGIRTILLTDKPRPELHFPGVEIVAAGEGKEITDRIRHLLPLIETEYVLVTLDDYFPIYPICTEKISRLISVMDEAKYDYIRFNKKLGSFKLLPSTHENVYPFSFSRDYLVNLYVGLWRKDLVAATLSEESLTAWDYEVSLTAAAKKVNARCAVSTGNEFPILDVVRKGKILRPAAAYLKKNELYHGSRPIRTRKETVKLSIWSFGRKMLSYGPKPVLRFAQKTMLRLGLNSFSAKQIK